ncbi:hypothetical protein CIB48_g227 [Xylaria polymorpha]|nr:hypothetical protein CIB48_g227 [Xylaria polymorpha]
MVVRRCPLLTRLERELPGKTLYVVVLACLDWRSSGNGNALSAGDIQSNQLTWKSPLRQDQGGEHGVTYDGY